MTHRLPLLALAVCLAPAAAAAQTSTTDLPRLSASISEQSGKVALDQASQAPKPAPPKSQPAPAGYKQKHWGVSASVTPQWKLWSKITNAIADEGQTWDIQGSEFTVGLVHGRSRGGDFGIDFVQSKVKNGSSVRQTEQQCTGNNNGPPCFTLNQSDVMDNVKMTGVKVHFFIPFVTIKGRVQAGINIGVGAAKISGNDVETEQNLNFVPNTPPQQGGSFKKTTVNKTENIKDVFDLPALPLFDLDVAVAFIVTPAIKVRWMAGIGIPGKTNAVIIGSYLFGAR
jgi:hypothetical protein